MRSFISWLKFYGSVTKVSYWALCVMWYVKCDTWHVTSVVCKPKKCTFWSINLFEEEKKWFRNRRERKEWKNNFFLSIARKKPDRKTGPKDKVWARILDYSKSIIALHTDIIHCTTFTVYTVYAVPCIEHTSML